MLQLGKQSRSQLISVHVAGSPEKQSTVVSGLIQDWVNSRIRIFEVGECRG